MTTVGNVYDHINRLAPFSTAMEWDNVGLLIGGREQPVRRILLALDLTTPVLEEAKERDCQLVVTHHPVIFKPLKRLDFQALPYRLAAAGMAVISAHTNLDLAEGGVNDALAQALGLTGTRPFVREGAEPYKKIVAFVPVGEAEAVYTAMAQAGAGEEGNYSHCAFLTRGEGRFLPRERAKPAIGVVGALETVEEVRLEMLCAPDRVDKVLGAMKAAHPYEQPAFDVLDNNGAYKVRALGRVGELTAAMSPKELAAFAKARLGATGVRFVAGSQPIRTVAVCGGSGGDYVGAVTKAGAQALVTGEVKHNQLLEAAEQGITLVEAGHFASENVIMAPLGRLLGEKLPEVEIIQSSSCTDGVQCLA